MSVMRNTAAWLKHEKNEWHYKHWVSKITRWFIGCIWF